jgi:hypothetical protein
MSAKVLANLLGTTPAYGTSDFLGYIPDLPEISAQTEQKKAIAGNIAALPEATQLAAGINKFNFQQLQDMLKAAIPNYDEIMQTGGRQLSSMLRGEVPEDVQRVVQRSRGAKSFAGGYGGSGMAGAAEAEDLGLTSLGIIREGLSASERWLQAASSRLPRLADATSMFISPQQQIGFAVEERNNRFNYNLYKAKVAASASRKENAVTGLTDWVEGILASAATMGIGGAMGGGDGMTSMMGGAGAGAGSGGGAGTGTNTGVYGYGGSATW